MTEFKNLHPWDRKVFLTVVSDLALESDDFFKEIEELIQKYSKQRTSKIGLEEISFTNEQNKIN